MRVLAVGTSSSDGQFGPHDQAHLIDEIVADERIITRRLATVIVIWRSVPQSAEAGRISKGIRRELPDPRGRSLTKAISSRLRFPAPAGFPTLLIGVQDVLRLSDRARSRSISLGQWARKPSQSFPRARWSR